MLTSALLAVLLNGPEADAVKQRAKGKTPEKNGMYTPPDLAVIVNLDGLFLFPSGKELYRSRLSTKSVPLTGTREAEIKGSKHGPDGPFRKAVLDLILKDKT